MVNLSFKQIVVLLVGAVLLVGGLEAGLADDLFGTAGGILEGVPSVIPIAAVGAAIGAVVDLLKLVKVNGKSLPIAAGFVGAVVLVINIAAYFALRFSGLVELPEESAQVLVGLGAVLPVLVSLFSMQLSATAAHAGMKKFVGGKDAVFTLTH